MTKQECIELLNSKDVNDIIAQFGQENNITFNGPLDINLVFNQAVSHFIKKYHIDRILDKQGNLLMFFDSEVQTQEEVSGT